jgi:trans-aconitate methyltransferase
MDKKDRTRQAYDEGAHALALKFNAIGSRDEDIRRAFSAIPHVAHPCVLEVGCGNGRDAAVILQYDCNYIGIDYSQSMITLAREKVPDATFLVADMEEYTPEHQVDIVFAFASLLHLPPEKFQNFLHNMIAHITPKGVMYISVKEGAGEHIKQDITGERYFYYYSTEDIMRMSGTAGFIVEHVESKEILGVPWITALLRKGE